MKQLLFVISTLVFIGLGIFIGLSFRNVFQLKSASEQEVAVMLEKVERVMKLVAVEGYFSEVYDYKDSKHVDWRPFTKKALIRVRAKVSVGYDLEEMHISFLPEEKVIRIENIPQAKILSIDHDLDYYDLQEGSFNSFSIEDYNLLNSRAKAFIETRVKESDLFVNAEAQLSEILSVIEHIAVSNEWTVDRQEGIKSLAD